MSELKTYKMVDEKYCADCVCVIPSEVYLKTEADKVIAELKDKALQYKVLDKEHCRDLNTQERFFARRIAYNKYKRCLAMAKLCNEKWLVHNFAEIPTKLGFYDRWKKRWLELAEKFKEGV